jgi:hypothetical protein
LSLGPTEDTGYGRLCVLAPLLHYRTGLEPTQSVRVKLSDLQTGMCQSWKTYSWALGFIPRLASHSEVKKIEIYYFLSLHPANRKQIKMQLEARSSVHL